MTLCFGFPSAGYVGDLAARLARDQAEWCNVFTSPCLIRQAAVPHDIAVYADSAGKSRVRLIPLKTPHTEADLFRGASK